MTLRLHSYAICGAAFGDEGKGRIVDMLVNDLAARGPVIVYRDNGGANAGHTVEFATGERVAFHQLPSGLFIKGATVVLGKDMVIHPGDLLAELVQIALVTATKQRAKIRIDEMAFLSLDTHRAFENVLKQWQEGGKGSTGRGIAPAYADVLLRHPLRMRDIIHFNQEKVEKHYQLYQALIKGLGQNLAELTVPTLGGTPKVVGTQKAFVKELQAQAAQLKTLVGDLHDWLGETWLNPKYGFVFEKAQAIGLDARWGVYPDVTASDTTLDGILSATQGTIDPDRIGVRAGVMKATYMSSVGTRQLPSLMETKLAQRIREDAHEYGATTKRPRDIAYLDIPAIKFFAKVGRLNALILTHMDVAYADTPIKVCVGYKIGKKLVEYRPDQEFLNTVTPVYEQLPSWSAQLVAAATTIKELPTAARDFIYFVEDTLSIPVMMVTTGPQRHQGIMIKRV